LCEEGAFSETELIAYERNWDVIRRENAIRETNIKEGMEKGRAESIEKTVVKSFKKGSSIDFISSITDLSNDEIISILQKH
jgi:hypothetical protein